VGIAQTLKVDMRVLLSSLLVLFSFTVNADKFIVASQNLSYYPHYDFRSPVDKGLVWAILEAYAHDRGHEFKYLSMPVLRLQKEVLKGSVDLIYPDHPTWTNPISTAEQKIFSSIITTTIAGTLVKPHQYRKPIESIKELSIPLGFSPLYWEPRISNGQLRLISTNDSITALELLHLGRSDAADCDYYVAQHLLSLYPNFQPMLFDPGLPIKEIEFMFSTVSNPELVADIDLFIQQNPQVISELKLRYGIVNPTQTLETIKEAARAYDETHHLNDFAQ